MWRTTGTNAFWESADLGASLDLLHPDRGVQVWRVRSAVLADPCTVNALCRPEGEARVPAGEAHVREGEAPADPCSTRASARPAPSCSVGKRGSDRGTAILQVRRREESAGAGERLLDSYARGTDLVATYDAAPGGGCGQQIYWRTAVHDDLAAAGVELIVSVQTERLDDEPRLAVGSAVRAAEVWRWTEARGTHFERVAVAEAAAPARQELATPGLLLYRLPAAAVSYAELTHPADFAGGTVATAGAGEPWVSRYPLLPERLEKGVLRRSRLQGLFIPRVGDQETAVRCYHRFAAAPPPLAT